jgi:hypothetical protein
MKKFEHKRVELGSPPINNEIGHNIQPVLNKIGEEGWELVSAFRINGVEVGYFKREMSNLKN